MSRVEVSLSTRSVDFLAAVACELNVADVESMPTVVDQPAAEADRVLIEDPSDLTPDEIRLLAEAFNGRAGMAAFECRRTDVPGDHPLTQIGSQLQHLIPAKWPVNNSSDEMDGTTKIRDIGDASQQSRSLTNQAMAAHQDGWLSMRGVLAVTGLWADSVPVERAATYSQNIVRLALDLRRTDDEAFTRLFADGAVKIVDRSGSVVALSPVLFVDNGRTQAFFRAPNDEYDVLPGADDRATARAIEFLKAHTDFGANGSVFTYLDRRGRGLLLNNHHCVHGRTAFLDGDAPEQKRVIASKWWASSDEYRDVVWE